MITETMLGGNLDGGHDDSDGDDVDGSMVVVMMMITTTAAFIAQNTLAGGDCRRRCLEASSAITATHVTSCQKQGLLLKLHTGGWHEPEKGPSEPPCNLVITTAVWAV